MIVTGPVPLKSPRKTVPPVPVWSTFEPPPMNTTSAPATPSTAVTANCSAMPVAPSALASMPGTFGPICGGVADVQSATAVTSVPAPPCPATIQDALAPCHQSIALPPFATTVVNVSPPSSDATVRPPPEPDSAVAIWLAPDGP